MSEIISEGSALPRVTLGFFLAVIGLVVGGTQFYTQMSDVSARQAKYIERRDQQHAEQQAEIRALEAELAATHDRIDAMCQELAAQWQEVVC